MEKVKVGDMVRFNGDSQVLGVVTFKSLVTRMCTVMNSVGSAKEYPEIVLEPTGDNIVCMVREFKDEVERFGG